MLIHANWGLGEALVSGQAEGDEYRLREDATTLSWRLAASRIGAKRQASRPLADGQGTGLRPTRDDEARAAALTPAQAEALGAIARDAARALDYSAQGHDLEWAWDGQRFWILQARPITAAARHAYDGLRGQPRTGRAATRARCCPCGVGAGMGGAARHVPARAESRLRAGRLPPPARRGAGPAVPWPGLPGRVHDPVAGLRRARRRARAHQQHAGRTAAGHRRAGRRPHAQVAARLAHPDLQPPRHSHSAGRQYRAATTGRARPRLGRGSPARGHRGAGPTAARAIHRAAVRRRPVLPARLGRRHPVETAGTGRGGLPWPEPRADRRAHGWRRAQRDGRPELRADGSGRAGATMRRRWPGCAHPTGAARTGATRCRQTARFAAPSRTSWSATAIAPSTKPICVIRAGAKRRIICWTAC